MDSNSLDKIKQKFDRWCDSDIDTDESWLAELETEPENKALASGFMGGYKAAKAEALREAANEFKKLIGWTQGKDLIPAYQVREQARAALAAHEEGKNIDTI